MKKIVLLLLILLSFGISMTQVAAGGGGYVDGMWNPNPDNGFTLENLLKNVEQDTVKKALEDNFKFIAQNSVYEDYTYNSTHHYSKQFMYNIFIPRNIQGKIKNIRIEAVENIGSPEIYPMMKTESSDSALPVSVNVTSIESLDGGYVSGAALAQRDAFTSTQEYGSSYTLQVFLDFKDGTSAPYSPYGYAYINADDIEGMKADLSNAYYSSQTNYGYPDVARLLKIAFERLEASTSSVEIYLNSLERVLQKGEKLLEEHNAVLASIAAPISNEEEFTAAIEKYGVAMQKTSILNDAIWQIKSEIETRKGSGIIDELFAN